MIRLLLLASIGFLLTPAFSKGQETFSIVAIDSASNKVGSAGASCLDDSNVSGGVYIITDMVPGKGSINTQARYKFVNQNNARKRMQEGMSADDIIEWLKQNDAVGNPGYRQYGIALFDTNGHPQTAAFTGAKADSFKGHRLGEQYAIQGNILKGPEVLDSMESRFLSTEGPLEKRLMAALQGANMPGADRRCLQEGVSSQSAFVRVAKKNDNKEDLYLDLIVSQTPEGEEPIDSLQERYNQWQQTSSSLTKSAEADNIEVYPNPAKDWVTVTMEKQAGQTATFTLFRATGEKVLSRSISQKSSRIEIQHLEKGVYFYSITGQSGHIQQAHPLMVD